MSRKTLLSVFCICSIVVSTAFVKVFAAEEAGVEQLLFLEIPSVITASKKSESINKAPSVVYVITAEEIKRSGYNSLTDILRRVPGFNISRRESTLLGSRGFTSDQNDKFVFLVDGAPMTNIMQDGGWGFMDMPNLAMVEKIEIVKGPGSTLWGSDASLGIINVFTKKGEDISGTKVTFQGETNDNQTNGNVMVGNKTDKGDYLISFTFANSKGFGNTAEDYNYAYQWGSSVPNPFYITSTPSSKGARLTDIQPSWELYSKIKSDDLTFKTRFSYMKMAYLWGDGYDTTHQDICFKHFYNDIEKESKISEDTTLTTKVNVHALAYERGVLTSFIDPLAQRDVETKDEMGISLESILNTVIANKHNIIIGAKVMSVNFGPSTRVPYVVGTGSTTLNGAYPGFKYPYVTDANVDNTSGIYAEDSFEATDKLTLVAGVSYEYNDLREASGQIMPRASAIYTFTEKLSAKYCYNTGYNRPPIDKKFHRHFGNVQRSEKVEEHDVQVAYNTEKTRVSVTGYSFLLFDYFTWVDYTAIGGRQGHFNAGDAKSDGCEVDVRHTLTSKLQLYGNLSYNNSKINNGTPNGDPRELYNLGFDYYHTKDISLNINVNGYMDMPNGGVNGTEVWRGDGEQLVDIALVIDNVLKNTSLTLTTTNAFDAKRHVGMTGWPGYSYEKGAAYGVKASYQF